MEEANLTIEKKINNIQKKDKIMNIFNILLIAVLVLIIVFILIHKLYLKENTYSLLTNDIVNSVETVVIENKDIEKSENGELNHYIVFSNDKIRNKIYVNEGVYNECSLGDETTLSIKDIYDKKGNILKEELLFNIVK